MTEQQAGQAVFQAAVDAESGHFAGHFNGNTLFSLQALERCNHVAAAGQLRTGGVGTVLALAREPHDDDAGENAQNQFGKDGCNDVTKTGTAAVILEHHLVDDVADDTGEEHHKGIHHALNQGQGDHVAVGNVANLMGHHRLDFIRAETLQHAIGYGYQ